ncbi:hypothetical protein SLJ91_05795 [Acinetobacter pittii]|uniref:hypothetical protein n=1 Tax=Acinetobacter pittii TaxID=48296 RepID=UPI000828D392|nr:hypothetical protein [Acinetobacter pittii]MDX8202922.1 hypothetical protein [Acinetobacter pittii]MDX8228692.1 hypothetical protein [Acinetobacter pittii]OCR45454.1 hypothetical protein A4220_02790 [Acinetobacter pittii]
MNLLKTCRSGVLVCLILAKPKKYRYFKYAQQKAVGLALVGYNVNGAYCPLRAFFVRTISMHSHFMVKLERDTFECVGNHLRLSTNPFQFCHPHLVVNGKTSFQVSGVHNHA